MFVQNPILWLVSNLVGLYMLVVFAYIVTQLLVQLGYAQRSHPLTVFINNTGLALVEPVLQMIRPPLPRTGNLDLSPIVLIIGLQFGVMTLGWTLGKLGLG